jgi:hypothetical protein
MLVFLAPLVVSLVAFPDSVRLDRTTVKEGHELLQKSIRKAVAREAKALGWEVLEDGPGDTLSITVRQVRWRNRTRQEIFQRPGGPGSETEAVVDVKVVLGGESFEERNRKGKAPGPFFGTTDMGELRGAPADRERMVQVVNQQKADALGRAVWEAIKSSIPVSDRTPGP